MKTQESRAPRGKGRRSADRRQKQSKVIDLVPAVLSIRNILVPTDFSDASRKAIRYAMRFAEQFRARITLLYVVEPAVYPSELSYLAVDDDALEKAAKEQLTNLAARAVTPGMVSKCLVRMGKPFDEITSAARTLDIDLIVIATHGYTGLKHMMLGSTAERVVRHAPCPVLVVREHEHEFA